MTATVWVVVERPFPYAGVARGVGERLQVTLREAAALRAASRVRLENDDVGRQGYETRVITARKPRYRRVVK